MVSHKKYAFLLLLLLALITSCATVPKKEKDTVSTATASKNLTVIDDTRFSNDANIRMRASISFKFPDMSNSASAVIEMAKKDSILITISGPLGISVGKLYANPNEFIMNNNLQSTTFTGIPTEKNIMQIASIPLSFNDLMSIFRTSTPQNADKYIYHNELSLFQLAESELYEELIWTNLNNDISRIERKNTSGQTVIIASFTEHHTTEKYRFAQKINLNFPTMNGTVEIKISDISILQQPTNPMRFTKPKSYREHRFE